jgi:hypothetical protein
MKRLAKIGVAVVFGSFPPIASPQTLGDVHKEAAIMVKKGRTAPSKTPAVILMERVTEPGVYDHVILVYGWSDNYAAASEIAEYARLKHKRDYRVKTVHH